MHGSLVGCVAAIVASGLLLPSSMGAQTVVNSTFVAQYGSYRQRSNWSPAEVPRNTASREYNVDLGRSQYVDVDVNATISNLTHRDTPGNLQILNHIFRVTGTTEIKRPHVSVVSNSSLPSAFNAGTLSAFSSGALTGEYELTSYVGAPATLKFRGANVLALHDAILSLNGAGTVVVDENGNDALRNLGEIDAASKLLLDNRDLVSASPVSIKGALELGAYGGAIFTASASLTNFDPATRTLTGGRFAVGQSFTQPGSGPIELRFAGADIVNNGSSDRACE